MTYRKLIDLKFKKGISTYELVKKFPRSIQQVSEVALLEVPETTLREIIHEEKALMKLIRLKRRFWREEKRLAVKSENW